MDQGGYERRPDLRHKRDVEVLRAAPLPARRTAAAPQRQPVQARVVLAPKTPSAFATWRATHYVADQALRVVAIAIAAVAAVSLTLGGLALLIAWALGALSGLLASAGGLVGAGVLVALVVAFTRGRGHAHSTTVTTTVTTTCKR
jgi:hypothetical protein